MNGIEVAQDEHIVVIINLATAVREVNFVAGVPVAIPNSDTTNGLNMTVVFLRPMKYNENAKENLPAQVGHGA